MLNMDEGDRLPQTLLMDMGTAAIQLESNLQICIRKVKSI